MLEDGQVQGGVPSIESENSNLIGNADDDMEIFVNSRISQIKLRKVQKLLNNKNDI